VLNGCLARCMSPATLCPLICALWSEHTVAAIVHLML
jgi:hypothetical protein